MTKIERDRRRRGDAAFDAVVLSMQLDARAGADRLVALSIASDDSSIRKAAFAALKALRVVSSGDVSVERLNQSRDAAKIALSTNGNAAKSLP